MSKHYTDEISAAARQALEDELPQSCSHGCGADPVVADLTRAVLDAVAPAIAARARREALERAAENATRRSTKAWLRLLARATALPNEIEAGR